MYLVSDIPPQKPITMEEFKEMCYIRALWHAGIPEDYRQEAHLIFEDFVVKSEGKYFGKVCLKERTMSAYEKNTPYS